MASYRMRSEWNFVSSKGTKALGCLSSRVVFQMTRAPALFERACYNLELAWGGISGCVYLTDSQVRLKQSVAGAGLCCPRPAEKPQPPLWVLEHQCLRLPGEPLSWSHFQVMKGFSSKDKLFPKRHSCLLSESPRTAAHQAPLSMGFSRQEYWSG